MNLVLSSELLIMSYLFLLDISHETLKSLKLLSYRGVIDGRLIQKWSIRLHLSCTNVDIDFTRLAFMLLLLVVNIFFLIAIVHYIVVLLYSDILETLVMPFIVEATLDLRVLHRKQMRMVLLNLRFCGGHSDACRDNITPLTLTAVKHILVFSIVYLAQLIRHLLRNSLLNTVILLLWPLISVLFSILPLMIAPQLCSNTALNDFLNTIHNILKLVLDINLKFYFHGFELVSIDVVINICAWLDLLFLAYKLVNLLLLGLNGALVDARPGFHLISHQFHFGVYLHHNLLLGIVFLLKTFLPHLFYELTTLFHFCIQIFVTRIYLQLVFDLILEVCYIIRLKFLLFGQLSFEIIKLPL